MRPGKALARLLMPLSLALPLPAAAQAPLPASTPTERAAGASAEITILAGGDVTLGHHLPKFFVELRERGYTEEQLLDYPFARIAEATRAADVFWVNLEGTLTRHTEKTEKNFAFRADPSEVAILERAGVDVVCLANNHGFDYGPEGLRETLATLEAAGIAAYGAGLNIVAARRPVILERDGFELGFLGYVYMGEHSIEPEVIYAGDEKPGLAGTHKDLETLRAWVKDDVEALVARVDFAFVSFHWGRESRNLTEDYQRELARIAVDAGADAVVGHHPHVLQGFEWLGPNPVAYSLGNFVFAGNWNPRRKEAALLELTVRKDAGGSKFFRAQLLPISVDDQPGHPFQPYFYGAEEAERIRTLIRCYTTAAEEGACEEALTPQTAGAAAP